MTNEEIIEKVLNCDDCALRLGRRLSKAWRIWKSENPDAELDRDEE